MIVASRFNHFIVDRLVDGAIDAIRRHGGQQAAVTLVKVPGAWEIPSAVGRVAKSVRAEDRDKVGIIALGAVMTPDDSVAFAEGRKEPVPRADIEAAARAANCHDFITAFPHGYDTIVGAKGAQLSGGQKQRVAIARALAGDPSIILADEPTAALDSTSGQLVMDLLRSLASDRQRAVVIVTHDSRTFRYADRIVAIEDGQLAASADGHGEPPPAAAVA